VLLKIYLLILQSHANMYPFWRCLWWPLPFSIYVSVSCIFVFVRVRVRVRGRVVVSVCLCLALSIFVSIVFVLVSIFVSFSSALSLFVVAFVALSLQGSLCFQGYGNPWFSVISYCVVSGFYILCRVRVVSFLV